MLRTLVLVLCTVFGRTANDKAALAVCVVLASVGHICAVSPYRSTRHNRVAGTVLVCIGFVVIAILVDSSMMRNVVVGVGLFGFLLVILLAACYDSVQLAREERDAAKAFGETELDVFSVDCVQDARSMSKDSRLLVAADRSLEFSALAVVSERSNPMMDSCMSASDLPFSDSVGAGTMSHASSAPRESAGDRRLRL